MVELSRSLIFIGGIMTQLIFSINAVLPIFIIALLGYLLKRYKFLNTNFIAGGTKFVFTVALPCMLYQDLLANPVSKITPLPIILAIVSTLILVIILRISSDKLIGDPARRSAFIQGSFRGNFVLLGFALINNISGSAGMAEASMMMAFAIPFYNIIAVLVLSESTGDAHNRHYIRKIITNPLIIATVLGVISSLVGLKLPVIVMKPISFMSDMAIPLALITLGASMDFEKDNNTIKLSLIATAIKILVFPLIMVMLSIYLGIRGTDLVVLMVFFGAPAAVSSFPMAYQMGADYKLASQIIFFSTALAVITLFIFTYSLRLLGYI